MTRLNAVDAQSIIDHASGEYDKLVQSGRLHDYEHDLTFKSPKPFMTKKDVIGVATIALGIGATVVSRNAFKGGKRPALRLSTALLWQYFKENDDFLDELTGQG